jgi:hypothetical protein
MTLQKKDFAFLKKFFAWSVGHLEDREDNMPMEKDPAILTLVPAIQTMFAKYTEKLH